MKNFSGLLKFDDGWVEIYTYLLSCVGVWTEFERKAPADHHRRIIELSTGLLFISAAKRALENSRVFIVKPYAELYAEQEVKPHGFIYSDLSKQARDRIYRCHYSAINADMAALSKFLLFANLNRGKYRLTDLGVKCYEYLRNDNDLEHDFRSVGIDVGASVSGPAAGRHNLKVAHVTAFQSSAANAE